MHVTVVGVHSIMFLAPHVSSFKLSFTSLKSWMKKKAKNPDERSLAYLCIPVLLWKTGRIWFQLYQSYEVVVQWRNPFSQRRADPEAIRVSNGGTPLSCISFRASHFVVIWIHPLYPLLLVADALIAISFQQLSLRSPEGINNLARSRNWSHSIFSR